MALLAVRAASSFRKMNMTKASMTPEQKIKWAILNTAAEFEGEPLPEVTAENVDELYQSLRDSDRHWDAECDVRGSGIATGLPCPSSRHYECKAIAAKMPDGSYVGWNYWYGGGKHGEPSEMDWMEDAYAVECVEEEKMVLVRTFTKVAP
jgi:hypothetical protein